VDELNLLLTAGADVNAKLDGQQEGAEVCVCAWCILCECVFVCVPGLMVRNIAIDGQEHHVDGPVHLATESWEGQGQTRVESWGVRGWGVSGVRKERWWGVGGWVVSAECKDRVIVVSESGEVCVY
jgi:hypothetical protein